MHHFTIFTMTSFVKNSPFSRLVKSRGVRRLGKHSRERLQLDLEVFAVSVGLLAAEFAKVQSRKIVKSEHVKLALDALETNQLKSFH